MECARCLTPREGLGLVLRLRVVMERDRCSLSMGGWAESPSPEQLSPCSEPPGVEPALDFGLNQLPTVVFRRVSLGLGWLTLGRRHGYIWCVVRGGANGDRPSAMADERLKCSRINLSRAGMFGSCDSFNKHAQVSPSLLFHFHL